MLRQSLKLATKGEPRKHETFLAWPWGEIHQVSSLLMKLLKCSLRLCQGLGRISIGMAPPDLEDLLDLVDLSSSSAEASCELYGMARA